MKQFNAERARELTNLSKSEVLDSILTEIEIEATHGRSVLYVYRPISLVVRQKLKDLGFDIRDHGSLAIQRDNLYHTITWQ